MVNESAPRSRPKGISVCTEPLPNDRVPTIVARLWSCKAPATISEAEAEPPLINAITGFPSLISLPARARNDWSLRPRSASRPHLASGVHGCDICYSPAVLAQLLGFQHPASLT